MIAMSLNELHASSILFYSIYKALNISPIAMFFKRKVIPSIACIKSAMEKRV